MSLPRTSRRGGPWLRSCLAASSLALVVYLVYLASYPLRGLRLPVGFDAPWYVWRASFVAAEGVGEVGTSSRPGHPILAAVLGSVTGLSQFELFVVLSLVLVAVLACAVGAFARFALSSDGWGWAAAVASTGVVAGATRLVGENVANLLNLALAVGAFGLIVMAVSAGGARSAPGTALAATALLVGSGLAHWNVLAVEEAVLVAALLLALPAAIRDRRLGVTAIDTEAGTLAVVGGGAGALVAAVVAGVLGATFDTRRIAEDPARSLPRLRTDVVRLAAPGGAALLGGFRAPLRAQATRRRSVPRGMGESPTMRGARPCGLRLLWAWTIVMAAGIVVGIVTLDLPPHRFVGLLAAFPGSVGVAAVLVAVGWGVVGRATGDTRRAGFLSVAAVVALLIVVALPAAFRWYRYPVLLDGRALAQAATAARYLETLPSGKAFVVVVDPDGPAGAVQVPLSERTIRTMLPPVRQSGVHVYVGDPADALEGIRSPADPSDGVTDPYWRDAGPVLATGPPTLVLKALAPSGYGRLPETPSPVLLGPGVALLRGPSPVRPVPPAAPPDAVPGAWAGMMWGAVVLGLLALAGGGWAATATAPRPVERARRDPLGVISLAPAMGAGVLILAGFVPAAAGVGLGGPVGVAVFATVGGAGYGAMFLARLRSAGRDTP